MVDISVGTLSHIEGFSSPGLLHSPWICNSRGSHSRRKRMLEGRRESRSSVCSLFEDLDPESSPLMKHLESKRKSGAKLSDEDFAESFPLFKKKMEKEFDEITEKFKRLSIDNPDIHDEVESDFIPEAPQESVAEENRQDKSSSIVPLFENYLKYHIVKNILFQLSEEGINLLFF